MRLPRWAGILGGVLLAAILVAGTAMYWLGTRDAPPVPASTTRFDDPDLVLRGEYLARLGNCATCHTTRGGTPYAGGRAVPTPFGTLYGPNLTPDDDTGIGRWSADDFWRALHEGKAPGGRLLYPAFPYPDYTQVTRADADAIYAYLRALPPARQESPPHALRFPYDQPLALAFWRALYFRPAAFVPEDGQDALWNRGAYLVRGLTHCAACHTPRNALGANRADAPLAGGMIPVLEWYAPPLAGNAPEGLGNWQEADVAALLRTGVSARGTAAGPMADVVYESLQHLTEADTQAMARYLKSLPPSPHVAAQAAAEGAGRGTGAAGLMSHGAQVYAQHCADCHGSQGEGRAPAFPPLAGNLSVLAHSTANTIRVVLNGGYAPGTQGNPRPHGMPPFRQSLSDNDVAAVVTYIRGSWGNEAAPVSPPDVRSFRSLPLY
ncbi:c-type cytochrome [Verticiella sediminum]|uniref:C-type cytochrome n=1 Tax=Verticiella sediminum TaxID=1247510 RepID=A0A556AQ93_9BURK|nr:cytochrome c [Verticiella sediminum]TSH95082.1 c-type cytochrome [Verticiella sediminum]